MKGMNCNEKYILHIENSRAEPVIWENLGKYGGTDMLGTYKIRTDLAVEARERFTEDNVEVRGVEVQEDYNEEKDCGENNHGKWCQGDGEASGDIYYN